MEKHFYALSNEEITKEIELLLDTEIFQHLELSESDIQQILDKFSSTAIIFKQELEKIIRYNSRISNDSNTTKDSSYNKSGDRIEQIIQSIIAIIGLKYCKFLL